MTASKIILRWLHLIVASIAIPLMAISLWQHHEINTTAHAYAADSTPHIMGAVADQVLPFDTTNLIDQGDKINVSDKECTVGAVDKAHSRLILARHCGEEGHVASFLGRRVGRFHAQYSADDDAYTADNDIGYIDVDDPAMLGDNAYDLDDTNSPEVKLGSNVCTFSRNRRKTTCSMVSSIVVSGHNNVIHIAPIHGVEFGWIAGDSGGPVWDAETGKITGVISGEEYRSHDSLVAAL